MHELAIVKDIADVIRREAAKHGLKRVRNARFRIGRLAAVQPEQLKACFAAHVSDGLLKGMKLEMEEEPVELRCLGCGSEYGDARFDDIEFAHSVAHAPMLYLPPPCPKCGGEKAEITGGKEMTIVELKGTKSA